MAIFNGDGVGVGDISDSMGTGSIEGYMGGVAIGVDFNKPRRLYM